MRPPTAASLLALFAAAALPLAAPSRIRPRPQALAIGGPEGEAALRAPECPIWRSVVPVGGAAIATALILGLLRRHVLASEPAEAAVSVILLPQFVLMAGSTIVILDSFALAEAANLSPGESGHLVGFNWLGAGAGFVLVWAAIRHRPAIWRERPRGIAAAGVLVNIVGVSLYLCAVCAVGGALSGPSAAPLLKGARVVGGFGQGLVAQLMVVTVQSLTPKAGMTSQMSRVFTVNAVGVGSGPVLAALAHASVLCPPGLSTMALPLMVQLVMCLGALLGVLLLFPDIRDLPPPDLPSESAISGAAPAEAFQAGLPLLQRALVAGCIAIFFLRSLAVSGVEVGCALLLERDFGMDRRLIGLAIGATFFAVIPLRWLHQMLKASLSEVNQFRSLAGLATVGTLLLFTPASELLPAGAALLMADSIVFPAAFLSDGLSYGVLMRTVPAEGSLIDKNHSALWCNLLSMAAARPLGAWVARYQLEKFGAAGQDRYALCQLLVCAAMALVFEAGVRPGIVK